MDELFSDELGRLIARAFSTERDRWRTLGGIARDAGLSREEVEQFVARHEDLFETAAIEPSGSPLYGLRDDIRAQVVRQPA